MELRAVRPAPDPLGGYVRVGYNDLGPLEQMLVDGRRIGSGLVFSPLHRERYGEVVAEGNRTGVRTVLDPKSLELQSAHASARPGIASLPWSINTPHDRGTFNEFVARKFIGAIVEEVQKASFSAVLAPTHFVESAEDDWLQIDTDLVWRLRGELDQAGLKAVSIFYPLIVRSALLLKDVESLLLAKAHLRRLPIDAIWLRVHPFGTSSAGPLALRRYIEMCRELHDLRIPLVAERSGTIGVALAALGAVGGVESGITFSETVNLDSTFRYQDPTARAFSQQPRIYLQNIGAFLDRERAERFFEARGAKSAFACMDEWCCPRGWRDMMLRPREHFLGQRARDLEVLSKVPESLRPGVYMEDFLRPATDRAVKASDIEPALLPARKRLESWRGTLRAVIESESEFSVSLPATGRRIRRSA